KDQVAVMSAPLVLAILRDGDSYGYAILSRVRELSAGAFEWSDGMLFPLLHRRLPGAHRGGTGRIGRGAAPSQLPDAGRAQFIGKRPQRATAARALSGIWGCLGRPGRRPGAGGGLTGGAG
ncbi:MAG TPA: PadR family transcriptional regulator, partial [Microbacterium sp.]|nr:PadR family transcriptional regulator [Microbacterium sp.]